MVTLWCLGVQLTLTFQSNESPTLRPLLSVFSPYQTELLQGNEKYLYLVWCAVKKILCFFSCDLYQGLTGIWECHVTKKTFSTKDVLFVMCPSLKWNNPASCWIHWITEIFAKRKTPLVPHKTVHQVLGCGNKKKPNEFLQVFSIQGGTSKDWTRPRDHTDLRALNYSHHRRPTDSGREKMEPSTVKT